MRSSNHRGGLRLAAVLRAVAAAAVLGSLIAGCRFPEMCDLYQPPDVRAASEGANQASNGPCPPKVRFAGRTYIPRPGVIVTSVGKPLDGVELRSCKAGGDRPSGQRQSVSAFAYGAYCTSQVIAVELVDGEQLIVFIPTD